MKRLFSILMIFYMVVVTCVPCNDQDTCADEKKTSREYIVSNHEHSDHEADLCSPFCVCNCCSSSVQPPKYFFFSCTKESTKSYNTPMRPEFVQPVSHSIWQPPRLS